MYITKVLSDNETILIRIVYYYGFFYFFFLQERMKLFHKFSVYKTW